MDYKVYKLEKPLIGMLYPPGDKSISHRSLILGAMANGETIIEGLLLCDDTNKTIGALRQLGVEIRELNNGNHSINGVGLNGFYGRDVMLDCGNSGTTMRLLAGILVGSDFSGQLFGDESLSKRSMAELVAPLRLMGADISGVGEKMTPPITIRPAKLKGIVYDSQFVSAQVKTAVLLSSLTSGHKSSYREAVISRDHTERLLAYLGCEVSYDDGFLSIDCHFINGRRINVPGDISSAAYFIGLAALVTGSEFVIKNVGLNSTRIGITNVLTKMGAKISTIYSSYENEPMGAIYVEGGVKNGVTIDENDIPLLIDELPLVAVLATMVNDKTVITGAGSLRNKESDRLQTIVANLRLMGANIEELPDGLIINGTGKLNGAVVDSYGDHRIAMSMTVAGLLATGETTITNVDCVDISYPQFFHEINRIIKL